MTCFAGEPAAKTTVRTDRQRGLAKQIAIARARRQAGKPEDHVRAPCTTEVAETNQQGLRDELRRIIAEDAERAASEQGEPTLEVELEASPVQKRSYWKTMAAGFAFLIAVAAVVLTR